MYLGSEELGSQRWIRGWRGIAYYAEDNLGVRRAEISVDGVYQDSKDYACDYRKPIACESQPGTLSANTSGFADGAHQVRITAYDAGGQAGSATVTARFDNRAPDRVAVAVDGGEGWRRRNGFDVSWSNPPEAYAPIAKAGFKLCNVATGQCEFGTRDGAGIERLSDLPVPASGDHTLEVWRIDEAGNGAGEDAKPSPPVRLRFDPNPPQLAFLPQDPSDPLRVTVDVTDDASGAERGTIEIRRKGGKTWNEVDAYLEGGRLIGYVDDQQFADGTYELRAYATDYAGNTGATDRLASGATAGLRLPVRVPTMLRVGARKAKVVRRVVRRRGRKRTVRRRVFRFVPRIRIGIAQTATLHGRLTNPDGQPIDGAAIEVFGRSAFGEDSFGLLGVVHTGSDGAFTYQARGSESRVLRFYYRGGRRIRAATREVFVRVPASSSISVSDTRVFNGDRVTFRGRLRGGRIPNGGKLLEMQAFFRNRWRTFSTVRSTERGRWRFSYQFGGTRGRITYRFRVLIPHEGGYPFDTGRSPVVRVAVRGP